MPEKRFLGVAGASALQKRIAQIVYEEHGEWESAYITAIAEATVRLGDAPRPVHTDDYAALDALEASGWSYNIYCSIFGDSKVYGVRLEPESGSPLPMVHAQGATFSLAAGAALIAWAKEVAK